jgi:hypothetical protein
MTDRGDRRRTRAVLAVALSAGLITGCAPTTPGGQTPVPATSRPPSADPSPTATTPPATPTPSPPVPLDDAPPSAGPSDGPVLTLTGTVEQGVEAGCLVLTADGVTYLLLGARALVRAGDRVTVEGVLATDVATTCQQGTPLRIREVRPG